MKDAKVRVTWGAKCLIVTVMAETQSESYALACEFAAHLWRFGFCAGFAHTPLILSPPLWAEDALAWIDFPLRSAEDGLSLKANVEDEISRFFGGK